MSQNNPEVEIAVLKNQMTNLDKKVTDGFRDMGTKLDEIAKSTKDNVDKLTTNIDGFHAVAEAKFSTKEELKSLTLELNEVKKIANSKPAWYALAGVAAGTVLTYLITFYLNHR